MVPSVPGTTMHLFAESEQGALALVRAVFFPGPSVAGPDDYHVVDMRICALPLPESNATLEAAFGGRKALLPPKSWRVDVTLTVGVHRHLSAMTVTVFQIPKEGD